MSELIDRQALLDECLNHYEVGNIEQNCTMDWICKTVRNFPAAPRWVRCEERLPKDQSPVLVFVPPHEEYDDYYYGYVGMAYFTYSAKGGFWCGTDGNLYGAVGMIHSPTHWMPLPEPPKEENDGN